MSRTPSDHLLIGAHVSSAGSLSSAILRGQSIGATTIQLFSQNQKTWAARKISPEELLDWQETLKKSGLKKIMVHDSYLINLGSPKEEVHEKSLIAFKHEIERCQLLGIDFLNFHPGAHLHDKERDTDKYIYACCDKIAESINSLESVAKQGPTRLLLEATAGQGTNVGNKFEHLSHILKNVHSSIPMGVCIDTCHIFSAGYDIRTLEGWEKTLEEFDRIVGLEKLYAFHVNDSKHGLGERKDRHACLGEGLIGMECFKVMMTHPKLREIPKYLETPEGEERWKIEIELLRKFAK